MEVHLKDAAARPPLRGERAGLGPRQRDDPATGDKRGEEALPLRGEEQETNAGPGLLQ